jgi:hypothetical protein
VAYWLRQGVWPIAGNFAYVEDVFSTWLYTGNGSTQTITNGIDLAGRGGLVWLKARAAATSGSTDMGSFLYDTQRGVNIKLSSTYPDFQFEVANSLTSFTSSGFVLGAGGVSGPNTNTATYASWTFREQPRFFDIVTYTGNGENRTIAHNLGSVPGCIMVKRLDASADWQVYHRSLANTQYLVLNSSAGAATGATRWNSTTPTDTVFSLGTDATVNASGGTYVAYLFAHDAGGFGATGTDNVISCGSFTTDGSGNATVNLGYEPQWAMFQFAIGGSNWHLMDDMRGFTVDFSSNKVLYANRTDAEQTSIRFLPNATGFSVTSFGANQTIIYIAIRRGPMRTPTTGTSVFGANLRTGTTVVGTIVASPLSPSGDAFWMFNRGTAAPPANTALNPVFPRLTGGSFMATQRTNAESSSLLNWGFSQSQLRFTGVFDNPTTNYVQYFFSRAPGFFDVVCYTGTGSGTTVAHNLGVAPELMIVKSRNLAQDWPVYAVTEGPSRGTEVNSTGGFANVGAQYWNSTNPTSAQFSVGNSPAVNNSGTTYVAYLFASCPGVSRVGSYTGTGATQTINCGFAAGARFVLIKRTNGTGDWYVWDSARGIVAGNDPYLTLNTTAAEVTTTDWVDTAASGFELSNAGGNLVNTNGGSYIFLAIS